MKVLSILLLALPLMAAEVTLKGTLYYPFGTPAAQLVSCTLTINLNRIGTSNPSQDFGSVPFVTKVQNGAYSFTLQANDVLTPSGTSYSAQFSACANGGSWSETWYVPSSPNPTTIGAVRASTVASPAVIFQPNQISARGLINGIYCLDVAGGTVNGLTSNCPGGGGGTGLASYVASMSGTSVTILASTHQLGTNPALVNCKDGSGNIYFPGSAVVNGSGDVTISSSSAMSGTCILQGNATGTGEYIATLTGTSVTILASTHGLGVNVTVPSCYDGSGNWFEPGSINVNGGGDVLVVSTSSMTGGRCILQ